MTTYIGLLRGINVGGKRKVKMAELARWCTDVGCHDVRTYIQSGNVVFTHPGAAAAVASELSAHISAEAGFTIPLALRTARQWEDVVGHNPFADRDTGLVHVTFLDSKPDAHAFDHMDRSGFEPEEFVAHGRELYLYLPNGMARTKLPQALGLYTKRPATTRNWRTVLTLLELASHPPG